MLAERERERREASRSAGLGHRQPSRTDLRPRSVAEDSDRDVPSYMRSTSASIKKEKLGNSPIDKIRLENLFLLHKMVKRVVGIFSLLLCSLHQAKSVYAFFPEMLNFRGKNNKLTASEFFKYPCSVYIYVINSRTTSGVYIFPNYFT